MPVKTDVDVKSNNVGTDDFVKAILEPGNYLVKINSIFLQPERDAKFGDRLILNLETKPIGGNFKGFAVSKDDATKGNHLGRVGNVGYSKYSFKDFQKDNGDTISKENELQVAIQDLCGTLGIKSWYMAQNAKKHADMAALIKALDTDKPFKDVWFSVCLAGKEYVATKYINYEMYFPFPHRTLGVPYHLDATKVIKFFSTEHVIPLSADKKASTAQQTTTPADPAKPVHQSQAELDFIKQGEIERAEKAKAQSNQDFLAEMNADNPVDEPAKDIITSIDDRMPWDV